MMTEENRLKTIAIVKEDQMLREVLRAMNIHELEQSLEMDMKDTTMLQDEYRARANDLRALQLDRAAEALVTIANQTNEHYNILVRAAQAVRERAVQLEAQQPVAYPEWPAIRWLPDKRHYEIWDYQVKQIYRATNPQEAELTFGRLGIGPAQFNYAYNHPYQWTRVYPRKTGEERLGEFFGMPEVG